MKLGNTSQSSVPVPNFFLNKNINQMETFQLSKGKRYFREKDLFQSTKEINFSNSTRNLNKKHENFNKTKYIPDLTSLNNFLNRSNDTLNINLKTNKKNETFNDNLSENEREREFPKKDCYQNFRNYMEKTNVTNYTNKDLRDQIKTNINVLIDKISNTKNYDLDKWTHIDTRTNFIDTNTDNIFNKNIFDKTNNNNYNYHSTKAKNNKDFKDNESQRFKYVIKEKVKGLSIEKDYKKKLLSRMDLNNVSYSDKFYKTKTSNVINTHCADEILKTETEINVNEDRKLNKLNNEYKEYKPLNTYASRASRNKDKEKEMNIIHDNLNLNLKKLCLPNLFNKYSLVNDNDYINQKKVDKLKIENIQIYDRFKGSNLFKEFPSPDRKEFIIKKGEKVRLNMKKDKIDNSLVDFSKYNANNHKDIFCESYETNQGFMERFRKSKDTFV
jgi:hypothetical protein